MFVTAVACFAVAIPLTSASTHVSQGQVTIRPGGSVRFAYMDWNCFYRRAWHGPLINGTTITLNPHVECGRESSVRGLRTRVEAEWVSVYRCGDGSSDAPTSCNTLLYRPRTP